MELYPMHQVTNAVCPPLSPVPVGGQPLTKGRDMNENNVDDNTKRVTFYRTWMVDYQFALPDGLPEQWSSMRVSQQEQYLREHGFLLDTKFSEYLGMDDGSFIDYDGKLKAVK